MASREELIRAIDLALSGDWESAHKLVQANDGDTRAARIHAELHRQEGDDDNAMYWYRRAGIEAPPATDPEVQLVKLRDELLQQA